jgi:hypothetical protein
MIFTSLGERSSTSMILLSRKFFLLCYKQQGEADLAELSQRHGSLQTENTSTLPPTVWDNRSPSTCLCATTSARSLEIPLPNPSRTLKAQMALPLGFSPVCPLPYTRQNTLLTAQTTMSFDMLLDMVFPTLSRKAVCHSLPSAENTSSLAVPSPNVTLIKVYKGLELLP